MMVLSIHKLFIIRLWWLLLISYCNVPRFWLEPESPAQLGHWQIGARLATVVSHISDSMIVTKSWKQSRKDATPMAVVLCCNGLIFQHTVKFECGLKKSAQDEYIKCNEDAGQFLGTKGNSRGNLCGVYQEHSSIMIASTLKQRNNKGTHYNTPLTLKVIQGGLTLLAITHRKGISRRFHLSLIFFFFQVYNQSLQVIAAYNWT